MAAVDMAPAAARLSAVTCFALAAFGCLVYGAELGNTTIGIIRFPDGSAALDSTQASREPIANATARMPTSAATSTTRSTSALPTAMPMDIRVEAGHCDANSRCTCSVSVPPPCAADEKYREILAVKERIREVDAYLDGSFIRNIALNVTRITSRIKTLEETLSKQSVSVSLAEIDELRKELKAVSSWISTLEGKVGGAVTESLTRELTAILAQIDVLERGNPVAARDELELQLQELRARLAKCKQDSTSLTSSPFPGDAALANETNYRTCSRSVDLNVGPQVTHKWRNGVPLSWLRDARPSNANVISAVYEIRTNQNTNQPLFEWLNYGDYSSARSEYLLKTKCLFHVSGRKHVLLDGFLYYFDYHSNVFSKLDTRTCRVTQTLKMPLEQSALNRYLHGEPTYADINYDETGMYVVYTSASYIGELVITKIDPVNMTAIKTWETGRQKSTIGNVFFVCGRMYTTDSFTVRHLTGKQFGYDTNVGSEFLVSIDVESRLGSVVQLAYNPRDRMIFGVDNAHTVTYNVNWD